jgi:hypothetical protein
MSPITSRACVTRIIPQHPKEGLRRTPSSGLSNQLGKVYSSLQHRHPQRTSPFVEERGRVNLSDGIELLIVNNDFDKV